MKTYEIECSGEPHRIGLDDEGYLHALDHSEHEEVLARMGEEAARCFGFIFELEDADEKEKKALLWAAAASGETGILALLIDIGMPASQLLPAKSR